MRVALHGACPGWGEDFPIYDALLARRGWALVDRGERAKPNWNAEIVWRYERPMTYEHASRGYRLQMRIQGLNQRGGPWYWTDYVVLDRAGETLLDLPRTDWADWDGTDLSLRARGQAVPHDAVAARPPRRAATDRRPLRPRVRGEGRAARGDALTMSASRST